MFRVHSLPVHDQDPVVGVGEIAAHFLFFGFHLRQHAPPAQLTRCAVRQ